MSGSLEYRSVINRPLVQAASELTAIGLFSGICGIEIGLQRAGFHSRAALDLDPVASDVSTQNRTNLCLETYVTGDINEYLPERLLEEASLKAGEVSVLAGGPPCQPFSKSGRRLGAADERGLLFKRYLEYLAVMKPAAFVLENVRGLFSSRGGEDFRLVLKEFDDSGYTVYWRILDAANFGVPQFRQRLFLVGFREQFAFDWPAETHGDHRAREETLFPSDLPFVTVSDAIEDLAATEEAPKLAGRYAGLLEDIPEGLNYSHYTSERGHPNPLFEWRSKFWYFLLKTDRNRPSLTIQAYPGSNTGPFHWLNRRLSIREMLRLQSFPDWFAVAKAYFVAHRLIGNAVPPLLAEAIGRRIRESLDARAVLSDSEFLRIRHAELRRGGAVGSGRGSGGKGVSATSTAR